jgi:hypothetical protein
VEAPGVQDRRSRLALGSRERRELALLPMRPEGARVSVVVFAYGGGTNSKGLGIELVKRGEPLHLTLFARAGRERARTYADVQNMSLWFSVHGYPPITEVQRVRADGRPLTLEEDCLEKGMLPSIAYGYKTCSQKFKIQPQDKYVNHWQPALDAWERGEKVTKLIGYHAGERHRAKIREDAKYTYRYPLIEWGMDYEDCVKAIAAAGLPQPGKSACVFCPSSKAWEIRALREEEPDALELALRIEENAQKNLTLVKGLGRDWRWSDMLDADERQGDLFRTPTEMPCVCIDGDEA